jgi:flagellin
MTVINTNVKALFTQSALKLAGRDSQVAMEQLSTGKRINNSKDDAAGLAIAARMTQNIQGLNQSIRNAGDAISMIQTAEGATQEITVMLQRMSELAVQSANSTYSADQRSYLDQEFQQLKQEIVRVSEMHEWNGFPILNGKAGVPVGAPKIETTDRAAVLPAGTGKVLAEGDMKLLIGAAEFEVNASSAADDTKSNLVAASSNAAGSAIAIAAAINKKLALTGVSATANGAEIKGAKTTVSSNSIQTDLFINGTKVSLSLTSGQTEAERRAYVMNSINAKTAQHGVIAGDPGNGGLALTTTDGRNLSVWYDGSVAVGSDFGLGMNTATTSDPAGVTGMSSAAAASTTTTGSVKASTVYGSVTLNSDKEFTINPGANSYPTEIVTSTHNQYTFPSSQATPPPTVGITFGGKNSSFTVGTSAALSASAFKSAINVLANSTVAYVKEDHVNKVVTNTSGQATLTLSAADVVGLVPGMAITGTGIPASTTILSIAGNVVTMSANSSAAVTALTTAVYPGGADTVYVLPSSETSLTFTSPTAALKPTGSLVTGTTGFKSTAQVAAKDPTYTNLSALGFIPGAVMAKNIGRLNFQVGPAANQLISIDLADFGKNGDVTGPITSDKAPTNLLTVQSANDVIMNVNKSLDRIAATRATMGAVMNRLTHVIDNLTNVVMNSESSRSQIEDADYAQASTELARTQIMQQAATAVLAQANTSQQTVLKLLQG